MSAGFVGFLDFVGYPASAGVGQGGRGQSLALGRLMMLMAMERSRQMSVLEMTRDRGEALLVSRFAERMTFAHKLHEAEVKHQKKVTERAMYSVLLSEV